VQLEKNSIMEDAVPPSNPKLVLSSGTFEFASSASSSSGNSVDLFHDFFIDLIEREKNSLIISDSYISSKCNGEVPSFDEKEVWKDINFAESFSKTVPSPKKVGKNENQPDLKVKINLVDSAVPSKWANTNSTDNISSFDIDQLPPSPDCNTTLKSCQTESQLSVTDNLNDSFDEHHRWKYSLQSVDGDLLKNILDPQEKSHKENRRSTGPATEQGLKGKDNSNLFQCGEQQKPFLNSSENSQCHEGLSKYCENSREQNIEGKVVTFDDSSTPLEDSCPPPPEKNPTLQDAFSDSQLQVRFIIDGSITFLQSEDHPMLPSEEFQPNTEQTFSPRNLEYSKQFEKQLPIDYANQRQQIPFMERDERVLFRIPQITGDPYVPFDSQIPVGPTKGMSQKKYRTIKIARWLQKRKRRRWLREGPNELTAYKSEAASKIPRIGGRFVEKKSLFERGINN